MPLDFYQTLGVSRDASDKDISSAYRRLARQYHPDVTGGDKQAEERFKQVNAANDVLSDADKRAAYDKWGDQWEHAEQLEEMQRPERRRLRLRRLRQPHLRRRPQRARRIRRDGRCR